MKKWNKQFGLLGFGVCALGCGATDETAARLPTETGAVSLHLVVGAGSSTGSSNATQNPGLLQSGALRANTAWAFVRHIEFYLPDGVCAPSFSSADQLLSDDTREDDKADDDESDDSKGHSSDDNGLRGDGTVDDNGDDDGLRGDGTVDDSKSSANGALPGDDVGCEDKLRFEGPWVVDLMTGETTPSLADLRVPAGVYRRVDVRFEDAKGDDVEIPSQLNGFTLVAGGQVEGAEAAGFDLRLDFNEDARFESSAGIVVEPNGVREFVLALDVNEWFRDVSLQECLDEASIDVVDGRLQLDDQQSCGRVENAIKDVMKNSHRLQ